MVNTGHNNDPPRRQSNTRLVASFIRQVSTVQAHLDITQDSLNQYLRNASLLKLECDKLELFRSLVNENFLKDIERRRARPLTAISNLEPLHLEEESAQPMKKCCVIS